MVKTLLYHQVLNLILVGHSMSSKHNVKATHFIWICPYRKKKKLLKERRKQRERVELKMDLPGVSIADTGDSSMFSLNTISKAKVPPITPDQRTLGRCSEKHNMYLIRQKLLGVQNKDCLFKYNTDLNLSLALSRTWMSSCWVICQEQMPW